MTIIELKSKTWVFNTCFFYTVNNMSKFRNYSMHKLYFSSRFISNIKIPVKALDIIYITWGRISAVTGADGPMPVSFLEANVEL